MYYFRHNVFFGIYNYFIGQRHAKRDLRTYAKSVDPDQPQRLRRRVWSGSALFDNHYINGTYFSCYVNNFITYRCFQHLIGADLGLHYLWCPKVPFSRAAGQLFLTSVEFWTRLLQFIKYIPNNVRFFWIDTVSLRIMTNVYEGIQRYTNNHMMWFYFRYAKCVYI